MTDVLTVIPARGGSKSVHRKNIQDLGGKPLIAHQIATSQSAVTVREPVVSTEDQEIAAVSKKYGAVVPFERPSSLAQDDVPIIAAVQHCAEYFSNQGSRPDYVVCLQPTSPFTEPQTIDRAVELMQTTSCDSVVSVAKIQETHPFRAYRFEQNRVRPIEGLTIEAPEQRQDRPSLYGFTGAVYVRKYNTLASWDYDDFALGEDIRGVVQTGKESLEIDTQFDMTLARALFSYEPESDSSQT